MENKNRAEYLKQYYLNNKEKYSKQSKENYQKYLVENPKFFRERENKRLKKLYGISLEDYHDLVLAQSNRCAICGEEETKRHHTSGMTFSLVVDHDHNTGKVRGLLCSRCNRSIGLFYENPKLLNKVVQYLIKD